MKSQGHILIYKLICSSCEGGYFGMLGWVWDKKFENHWPRWILLKINSLNIVSTYEDSTFALKYSGIKNILF